MRTYCWDIETTDLKADIGSLIVVCFGELDNEGHISRFMVEDIQSIGRGTVAQREKKLAQWALARYAECDILIGHNSLAFDRHFLNGVAFRHRLGLVPKKVMHIDTYQAARGSLAMSGSMRNLVDIMGIGVKDAPSKDDWRNANQGDANALARVRERCIADVKMTAEMWLRLKHVFLAKWGK